MIPANRRLFEEKQCKLLQSLGPDLKLVPQPSGECISNVHIHEQVRVPTSRLVGEIVGKGGWFQVMNS